ncbi:MAG: S8 family serine peptidase [Proteobacteria bacterium]|nr:S8 family serine peptidase [Pseudomonadota bacterium]
MRASATLLFLAILCWLPGTGVADPAGPRIIVAFANQPHVSPAPAGTTGSHYAGVGYNVAQDANGQARRIARTYSLRALDSWPIQALALHCVVYEITDGREVTQVLAALARDKGVVLAQPLQQFHTLTSAPVDPPPGTYNDPLYELQGNLGTLGIPRAHERTRGAGLKVALIDTAVDAGHPDLSGRISASHSYLPPGTAPGGSLRHGTAMAGIIAAVANNRIGIVGIAPEAHIEVYAACWQLAPDADAAACNTFTLAQALAAAIDSGAPLVNLSIAGPRDPLLSALVQHGLKKGVTFVGAFPGTDAGFPTDIPGVISAGGPSQALPPQVLSAPDEGVMTLRPQGQYDLASGSSVAAAEISGLIALLMSASSARLEPAQVRALLQGTDKTAERVRGTVDVNAALARLDAVQHHAETAARNAR